MIPGAAVHDLLVLYGCGNPCRDPWKKLGWRIWMKRNKTGRWVIETQTEAEAEVEEGKDCPAMHLLASDRAPMLQRGQSKRLAPRNWTEIEFLTSEAFTGHIRRHWAPFDAIRRRSTPFDVVRRLSFDTNRYNIRCHLLFSCWTLFIVRRSEILPLILVADLGITRRILQGSPGTTTGKGSRASGPDGISSWESFKILFDGRDRSDWIDPAAFQHLCWIPKNPARILWAELWLVIVKKKRPSVCVQSWSTLLRLTWTSNLNWINFLWAIFHQESWKNPRRIPESLYLIFFFSAGCDIDSTGYL